MNTAEELINEIDNIFKMYKNADGCMVSDTIAYIISNASNFFHNFDPVTQLDILRTGLYCYFLPDESFINDIKHIVVNKTIPNDIIVPFKHSFYPFHKQMPDNTYKLFTFDIDNWADHHKEWDIKHIRNVILMNEALS